MIDAAGDTVSGLIDYRNWEKNPASIHFKRSANAPKVVYYPMQVKFFQVADEQYEGAIVNVDKSPYKIDKLNTSPEQELRTDTIFLQALIQGPKSLLYYKDKDGKEHFFIRKEGSFELLIFKKYIKDDPHRINVIAMNQRYLGQLSLYLTGCPSVQEWLKKTKYNQKSLTNAVLKYYECTEAQTPFHKKEKTVTEWGIIAGASITTLRFSSDNFDVLVNTTFNTSVDFAGGMFLDFILPRNSGKWSVNNELLYTSYTVEGKHTEAIGSRRTVNTMRIGYSYLKLNNMLRFKYPIGSAFVYLNAGISNGIVTQETNYKKIESTFSSRDREGKTLDETRKLEQAYLVGLGARLSKFRIESRLEKGNGISVYSGLGSSTRRFYFLLGYQF